MYKAVITIMFVQLFYTALSQPEEMYRLDILKAKGDTVDGKISGVWTYYNDKNGQLAPRNEFTIIEANRQLIIYPPEEVDTIRFYNIGHGKTYIVFAKPINRELINVFIDFESEVGRITEEVITAETESKLINFSHVPSYIVELESMFKEMISRPNNKISIIKSLYYYKANWYENYLKINKIDAVLYIWENGMKKPFRKSIVNGVSTYFIREYYTYSYPFIFPYKERYFEDDALTEQRKYFPKDSLSYTFIIYHPDQSKRIIGQVKLGKKDGLWKYYDLDRKLIRKEKYQKDILKSGKK
jgi:hypothetical protein